ncbi:ParB N-terminal domain-containing protein [Plantactinospora solaniradicis]|uniref:ParB N-terminal domain-containing protein n=1 Tax=Plantactinospora solaniradicis TaxID=1723736 RepID=A0ABW1K666_9ACTN
MTGNEPFQVMPELTEEEYASLRQEIQEFGVLVPVVKDQHGRILDGHNRAWIADELGVEYRVDVVQVADDDQARTVARTLNLARRHLSREQKRRLIADEIEANPDRSDREIGRLLSCDHKTVGSVRRELRGEVPQQPVPVDPNLMAVARTRLAHLEAAIQTSIRQLDKKLLIMLMKGHPVNEVVGWLTTAWLQFEQQSGGDEAFLGPVRKVFFTDRVGEILKWPNGAYGEDCRSQNDELRDMYVAVTGVTTDAAGDAAARKDANLQVNQAAASEGGHTSRVQAAVDQAIRGAQRIEQRGGRGGGDRCSGCVLCEDTTVAHYLFGRPSRDLVRYVYRDSHGVIFDRYLRLDDIPDDVLPLEEQKLPSGETYYERRRPLEPCGVDGCDPCKKRAFYLMSLETRDPAYARAADAFIDSTPSGGTPS